MLVSLQIVVSGVLALNVYVYEVCIQLGWNVHVAEQGSRVDFTSMCDYHFGVYLVFAPIE